MATANLAPGVEIIERSFSQRIEAGDLTSFATLGLFSKGPVNEVVTVTSTEQLNDVFGTPDDTSYKYYFPVAKILDEAPVQLVRIEDSEKNCASITVAISAGELGTIIENPIQVKAYPLSYDSIFTPDDDSITQVEYDSNVSDTILVAAVGPGTYYENINVSIINYEDYGYLQDLQLSLAEANTPSEVQAVGAATYSLAVSGVGMTLGLAEELIDPDNSYDVDGELLETYLSFENGPSASDEFMIYEFENQTLISPYLVSVDSTKKDSQAKSLFANRVVEEGSVNIRVFVSTSKTAAAGVTVNTIPKTALAGADALSTSIATLTDECYTQLNENFSSKEEIAFTAFVDLDFPLAVKQRMDEIAQVRKDVIALLNVESSRMINLNSGQKTKNQTTLVKTWVEDTLNINSSYSGVYANYFQVYDQFADELRWIPYTGHVANRMAFTFNNYEPWFAVAGLERGIISGVQKVAYNPNDKQRKVIYPARINPIVDFRGDGIVIYGQKTLQSFASNTDRLNVRNLLIYLAKALESYSRTTLFKQNDEFSRAEWRAQVGPFLNSVLQRRGVLEYKVICSEENNPPEVVARNEFQAYVIVRPTPVAEFIKVVIADVGGALTISEVLSGVIV